MKMILFSSSLAGMIAASAVYAQSRGPLEANTLSAGQASVRYTVTDLGLVGGPPGQPFVVTNNGLITGSVAVTDTVFHAVLWFQQMKIDIAKPGLGGPGSAAFGVNPIGQAVGGAETSALDPNGEDFCGFGDRRVCQPFIWQNGLMASLPLLKDQNGVTGISGIAESINSRGQIVGTAENGQRDPTCPALNQASGQYQQFQFKPVIWQNGVVHELPTVSGDPDGIAFAINDNGQAVGATGSCTAFLANGDLTYLYGAHAVLWQNGTVTDLGNLGGIAGGGGNTAFSINNRGQVVGHIGRADGPAHAYLWSKTTGIQDLGTLPGDFTSVALGINENGDIVGISLDADFNPRAYLRPDNGTLVDLNSLIPPDSPLFLFDACSINSRGEIIGIAVDGAGKFHGYLAAPRDATADSAAAQATNNRTQFDFARKLLLQRLGFDRFGGRPLLRR